MLLSAVAGNAIWRMRRPTWWTLPPLRFLAASALEARRKEEQEELARSIEEKAQLCSPDAGAEAQDRRDLRRVSGLSLHPAGEEEEEEEEEEKASSVCSSSTRLSTSL